MNEDPRASVLIIYTGGTIGMVQDKDSGMLLPFDFDLISSHIPELQHFDFNIDSITFETIVDSSNMDPSLWGKLAKLIQENYEDYDGFVILHGSDTMSYTASALSFMLENLNKPVILTGSQLPIGVNRTDGKENLITSLEIAAAMENNTPLVPEVCIYFEYQLYRGNRTFKFNAENFDAFQSVNYPVLATAGVYIRYNHNYIRRPNFKRLHIQTRMERKVAVLKLFPGIPDELVKAVLNIQDLKGVVMETYGNGNTHTEKRFMDLLEEATTKGIIILNVTQCKGGFVEIGKYQTSIELGKIGVVGGLDMTTEAAITKMMYVLAKNTDKSKAISLLQKDLRGELTPL